jgi:hypothetical protein
MTENESRISLFSSSPDNSSGPDDSSGVYSAHSLLSAGQFEICPIVDAEAWFDAHALDDRCMGNAYESIGGRKRASLKLCIARLHEIYGESPLEERRARFFRQEFRLEEEETPVEYALIVCEAAYPFASAFLAAIMPAVLAGVRRVLPCFVFSSREATGREPAAPLLASLELAGVERAFAAAGEDLPPVLRSLDNTVGQGRLLLIGSPPCGEQLVLLAHRFGLAGVSLPHPPQAGSLSPESAADGRGYGGAVSSTGTGASQPALFLDEGHKSVWIWPDLPPSWFRQRKLRLSSF